MMPDRSKLKAGTRTEELLKAMLLVLDEINEKLGEPAKSANKYVESTDKAEIVSKVSSIVSKTRKK